MGFFMGLGAGYDKSRAPRPSGWGRTLLTFLILCGMFTAMALLTRSC